MDTCRRLLISVKTTLSRKILLNLNLNQYIKAVDTLYRRGNATEHSYRSDFQVLLNALTAKDIFVTNEPRHMECGAPDYILTKKEIPVGFIEAKNIGDNDLSGKKKNKEQFNRYRAALNNLIFTDYLDFHFYRNGEKVDEIRLGKLQGKTIVAIQENFERFTALIQSFSQVVSQSIDNPKALAELMAGKAKLMADVINNALESTTNGSNQTLKQQFLAFESTLMDGITEKEFADVYAQTIAYGLFAARANDKDKESFSRAKAAEILPKSNPFLRKLFGYIAGPDIDDRIKWIVDDLVQIFLHCDVLKIISEFEGDPIVHFYETFLGQYDPKLRASRGVWYTPYQVVKFIVEAVDVILKDEFNSSLEDNSKITFNDKEIHRPQILDPATGTGTFLMEIIRQTHAKFHNQLGVWPSYVKNDLFPRLNGFELLMASYAMAHFKFDLTLQETGYTAQDDARARIFLTNALEESTPESVNQFANWLSEEANEAGKIKRETPVMCVVGNPPYSGISQNNSEWITNLIDVYKKEPGGKKKLKERKHWLNDGNMDMLSLI